MAQGDFTRINTNIGALNALNSLKSINTQMGIRQLRLATGKRINEAAEDPAGLTIATKFKYRASGLGMALDNIGDAKNLMAVAEGGLTKINDILVQIRDKTLQAANDALGADERDAIKGQISSFLTQIDNIVTETTWNGQTLIGGAVNKDFQTGADNGETTNFTLSANYSSGSYLGLQMTGARALDEAGQASSLQAGGTDISAVAAGKGELSSAIYRIRVTNEGAGNYTFQLVDEAGDAVAISSTSDGTGALTSGKIAATNSLTFNTGRGLTIQLAADVSALTYANGQNFGFVGGFTASAGAVDNNANANAYLARVNDAIGKVSKAISNIGALTARLTFKEETLSVAKVNTEAAHNRIMNADMAYEQLEATKLSILQQTATAMLSQANQSPQSVLSLFR